MHRDLKPGNILVDTTGTPKLLDFGISKLLQCEVPDAADTQAIPMATPDYASPEQIVGNPVTPASDIYSLGVVLYELLTGVRPHRIKDATPQEVEHAICLDPVALPSDAVNSDTAHKDPRLARRLPGLIRGATRPSAPQSSAESTTHVSGACKKERAVTGRSPPCPE
jgi:serine/threonine protein kinase